MFVMSFPACPEGITISDVKMMQTVSGKINLDFEKGHANKDEKINSEAENQQDYSERISIEDKIMIKMAGIFESQE